MSRYTASVCRLCRRETTKLYLKGERCFSDKCAVERRSYAPGEHGKRRVKMAGYGQQLREKQRLKRTFGMVESQFRKFFRTAERMKGVTGVNLLVMLERRLDNVAYRLGYGSSRPQARQIVRHGHVLVNGKRIDLPSYLVNKGDVITVHEKAKKIRVKVGTQENLLLQYNVEAAASRGVAKWLELDRAGLKGTVISMPAREDMGQEIQENLIVELYSK